MTRQCASCGVQTASPDLPHCPLCGGPWHDDEAVLATLMRRLLAQSDYVIGTDWFTFLAIPNDIHLKTGEAEALKRSTKGL